MRIPIGIAVVFVSAAVAAQTPAGDAGEPLRLVSLSHFIHATEHLETTLAFYKNVFDFDATPPRRINCQSGRRTAEQHAGHRPARLVAEVPRRDVRHRDDGLLQRRQEGRSGARDRSRRHRADSARCVTSTP